LTGPTSFEYQFAADANEVFFSNTIPYTENNWQGFLQGLNLQDQELCRSRKGRRIEMLALRRGSARPQFLITARHHCCETMASFVLEGMALELLQNWPDFALLMLPFMDKDGCEDGDQGNNRRPHDHNRDYGPGGSLYPSVQALREYVPKWLQPGAGSDSSGAVLCGESLPLTPPAGPLSLVFLLTTKMSDYNHSVSDNDCPPEKGFTDAPAILRLPAVCRCCALGA